MNNVLTTFLEGMSHRGVAVKSQINRLRMQLKGTDNESAKEAFQTQIDLLTTQLGQIKSTQTEAEDNELDKSVNQQSNELTEELQPWDVYTKSTEALWHARSREVNDIEARVLGGDYGNEMEADMVNSEMEDDPDPDVRRKARTARSEFAGRLKKAEAAVEVVMKKWEPKLKAAWIAANQDAYAWLKSHGHMKEAKEFGFAFKKQKLMNLQGFTSFREGEPWNVAPIGECPEDTKNGVDADMTRSPFHKESPRARAIGRKSVKESVYKVFDGYTHRLLHTHVPPRPLAEENTWKCPICQTWTNDVMDKSCAGCKVKIDRVQFSTEPLKEAIGNAPTRNGFFKNLVQKFPGLPARYRNVRDNFVAESQDKPTLHKISVFAIESGLQSSINKSGYGDWDSTWILTVKGFRE